MTQTKRTHITFSPIPCQNDNGKICLSIYPPHQFINNEGFSVFVGGGGYGERDTLEAAKEYLLECAKETCRRRIAGAAKTIVHYQTQLERITTSGLENEKEEAN